MSEFRIPGLPGTLVADSNSLSSDSLPHELIRPSVVLCYRRFQYHGCRFFLSPCRLGPIGYEACPLPLHLCVKHAIQVVVCQKGSKWLFYYCSIFLSAALLGVEEEYFQSTWDNGCFKFCRWNAHFSIVISEVLETKIYRFHQRSLYESRQKALLSDRSWSFTYSPKENKFCYQITHRFNNFFNPLGCFVTSCS